MSFCKGVVPIELVKEALIVFFIESQISPRLSALSILMSWERPIMQVPLVDLTVRKLTDAIIYQYLEAYIIIEEQIICQVVIPKKNEIMNTQRSIYK